MASDDLTPNVNDPEEGDTSSRSSSRSSRSSRRTTGEGSSKPSWTPRSDTDIERTLSGDDSAPTDTFRMIGPDGDEDVEEEPKKKKKGGLLILLLSLALIIGGATIGVLSFMPKPNQADAPRDMDGNIVVPDDPRALSSEFLEAADMRVDDGGKGFKIPAVQLNVPLGSVNAVDGEMNPPNYSSSFVIRNMGVPLTDAQNGTVYMVAHATARGRSPGNYIQKDSEVLLKPGDFIEANNRVYSYVRHVIVNKNVIADVPDLWDASIPGRLVFITCQVRPTGGIAVNNIVIIAELVS